MDDELSDIFAFILSSDKVSAEDAKIIREFKADTDTLHLFDGGNVHRQSRCSLRPQAG